MKTGVGVATALLFFGCGRGDGMRPLDEHVFKEYPVCAMVQAGVPCRDGETIFPLGWDGKYQYHYKDKLYRPS